MWLPIDESFVNVGGVASEFIDFKCAIKFVAAAADAFLVVIALHFIREELNFVAIKNISFCVWVLNARTIVHGPCGVAFAIIFSFSKACC